MPKTYWLCRRVACGRRNPATSQKCECGDRRPKKRVPAHAKALRDVSYEAYLDVNERIHGVDEVCAVCGKERDQDRRLDRDHEHSRKVPWHGKPRGLCCVECNILMPPKLLPERARQIAAYLTRVENYYGRAA